MEQDVKTTLFGRSNDVHTVKQGFSDVVQTSCSSGVGYFKGVGLVRGF